MAQGGDPVAELRRTVEDATAALRDGSISAAPTLERPPRPEFGDYSTNAAMLLAPTLGDPPRGIAERLADELSDRLGASLDRVEVAGPGFLNLFLSDAWYHAAAAALLGTGEDLGRLEQATPERFLVEFVSANPTGPLTAASGRHAAYGDSLSRVLEFTGQKLRREYYVNDVGGQIDRFAQSIAARMRGEQLPEDGYEGEYVKELAEKLLAEKKGPDDLDALARRGAELMVERIERTLHRFEVDFDGWSYERSLHNTGDLERAVADLKAKGHVYESEGATWLRTTEFGDDKDRVLVRSGGEPTYYLADIAYHRFKLERGFERLIDVLGADHHGYVDRLRAGLEALGFDPSRLEIPIVQLVQIVESGQRTQMSKRKGEFVTLDDLVDDIGVDAARFFMLQRSHDTAVDLDLELARRQSDENPVYYVQYAHARIASILRKAGEGAVADALAADPRESEDPLEPAERRMLLRLLELPGEVAEAAARRAPHRLCAYSMTAAADFHAFYRDCKVVGAEGAGVEAFRIGLCVLTKRAIARTLRLLGVSAPERM